MFDLLIQERWPMMGLLFLFGAIWGSFANVVIYRLPEGLSVVRPRSRCPQCQKPVAWFDNIPILSWFVLRGQCRNCQKSISWRYPLVEALTGILFAAAFYFVGWQWLLLEYLIFIFGLVVVSFIDFDHMILPDVFTLGGTVLGLLGAVLNPERDFLSALGGVLGGGGFLWAIAFIYLSLFKRDGMGGGDIKLLAWIGAVLGFASIPFVILSSSIIGSAVGLGVAARKKVGLRSEIPFGPYLALGAILYIFGGYKFSAWYFGLFALSFSPVN